jgi:hypothetical protein
MVSEAGMSGATITEVGPLVASLLALGLSLFNLYFQRRDRKPRMEIRVRYEYRASGDDGPHIHDGSQERLYLLLGDFLREYGLEYPEGIPVVRFALSNRGERPIYLDSIRLAIHEGSRLLGAARILDLKEEKVVSEELAQNSANILSTGRSGRAVELVPGESAGYRFELIPLAKLLAAEGYSGDVRLTLEARDRLGNVYRKPFSVNTDLWCRPREKR